MSKPRQIVRTREEDGTIKEVEIVKEVKTVKKPK